MMTLNRRKVLTPKSNTSPAVNVKTNDSIVTKISIKNFTVKGQAMAAVWSDFMVACFDQNQKNRRVS